MNWQVHTNVFGGRSVSIAPGCNLADVPAEFTDLLADNYRQAHNDPQYHFEALAGECEIDGLARLYRAVATAGGGVLQVHLAEPVSGHFQTDVLFQVQTRKFISLSFRLPRSDHSPSTSNQQLQQLYRSIDGTVEGGIWESGGIEKSDAVGFYVGDRELKDPEPFVPPNNRIDSFYRTDTGDYLFASGDIAVWYRHEDSSFVEAGQLVTVIDQYFTAALDDTPWLSDPYSLG